jgi:hypothetical protein
MADDEDFDSRYRDRVEGIYPTIDSGDFIKGGERTEQAEGV